MGQTAHAMASILLTWVQAWILECDYLWIPVAGHLCIPSLYIYNVLVSFANEGYNCHSVYPNILHPLHPTVHFWSLTFLLVGHSSHPLQWWCCISLFLFTLDLIFMYKKILFKVIYKIAPLHFLKPLNLNYENKKVFVLCFLQTTCWFRAIQTVQCTTSLLWH